MNLDDFRARAQRITAPTETTTGSSSRLNSFIDTLRKSEEQAQQKYKWAVVITVGVSVALFAVAVQRNAVGTGMIAAVYLLIAGLSWSKSRLLARVEYSGPPEQFLHRAKERYRFWGAKETLIAVPGLIFLALGGALVVQGMARRYFSSEGVSIALIAYAVFFSVVVILGFVFSWSDWKKGNGKTFAEICKLERELANG